MKTPAWLPALLGLLTAVGPVSTDMYLPAFPAIEASLHSFQGSAQITLAAWFVGLAFGQITQGTLSDRMGRRAPLIFGTALYTLASAGCALAPNLGTLTVCRAVAAFGGSASMVIPRAMVRDLADGNAAARMMSQLILVMGVAPILAPTLGGLLLGVADWRAIFWVTVGFGALSLLLVITVLPDTLPETGRVRLPLARLVSRYANIAVERSFITHAMIAACGSFGVFAYLSGAPTAFIEQFGVSPTVSGLLFGANGAGYILFSQVNARLLGRFGMSGLLRFSVRVYLVTCLIMTVLAFGPWGGLWGMMLPLVACMSGMGLLNPNAMVGALSRHAAHAGSASALMGTLQYILGAMAGALASWLTDGTSRPTAALMLAGALGATVADLCRPRS